MRGRGYLLVAGALSLSACDRASSVTPEPAPPVESASEPAAVVEPETASNKEAGELVEVSLPVLGTEPLSTTELRGRPLLLVVTASFEPGFERVDPLLRELQGQAQVVLVLVDPDPGAAEGLQASAPGYRVAWDPQGAVAAQLRAATFPTVLLVDAEGHLEWQSKTLDAGELRAHLPPSESRAQSPL